MNVKNVNLKKKLFEKSQPDVVGHTCNANALKAEEKDGQF